MGDGRVMDQFDSTVPVKSTSLKREDFKKKSFAWYALNKFRNQANRGKRLTGAHRSNSAAHTAKTQPRTQIQLSHAHKPTSAAHTDTTHVRTQIQLICAHKMEPYTHIGLRHTLTSQTYDQNTVGVGLGWGARTFLAHHFRLLAHCIHVLVSMDGGVGVGGVGSVAIMYLRGAHGLDAHLVSPSSDTCSLHPRPGQDGRGGHRSFSSKLDLIMTLS